MSYILDALRRAEADRERERGQVPGLHTPPASGGEAARATAPRRWLPWAGGGLLLMAGIAAGSWWASAPQDTPAPQSGPATPAPLAAAVPAVAPAPAPASTTPVMAPTPPAVVSNAPLPLPAASASPYLPALPPLLAAAPAPAPATSPAPSPAPTAPPEARIPRLAELPEALRNELPKLAINGSIYSDDPRSRFVVINGEVVHEGAKLGAELVLEEIRPRELVLRFKGQRFRQPV